MTLAPSRGRRTPIPLTLLTGFLGAGKTTLLNRLLRDPEFAGTAVIVNEFGAIGLDHLLVESAADGIIELSSGCVCCSVRGELVDALERLLRAIDNRRIGEVRRVVIETTGLAEPGPILRILLAHPYLRLRFELDGIVTVVDAVHGAKTLAGHAEAVKQAAVADRIVVSKTDLTGEIPADLRSRLAVLNPLAEIVDAQNNRIAAALTGIGARERGLAVDFSAEAIDHDHGPVDSLAIARDGGMDEAALAAFLERLEAEFGDRLLRVKGVIGIADGRPAVIHGVQGVYSPVLRLDSWPGADRRSRLVVIGRDLDRTRIETLFDGFLNMAMPDTPDRSALAENPLAIAGFSFRK
jgi:G3E family GTPase